MSALYWATSVASLVAVVLNIHGRRAAFGIWCVTNLIWTVADLQHGLPQQAAVQAAYFGLSVYGLWRWRAIPIRNPPTPPPAGGHPDAQAPP